MAASDVLFISVVLVTIGLGLFVIFFASRTITAAIIAVPVVAANPNATAAFNSINTVTNRFDYLFFAVFIGLVLAMIVSGYFVGGHPIFMFVYFLIIVISVICSALLANVWEQLVSMPVFGASWTSFPITMYILGNLPYFISVIGIVGLLAMFAKPYVGGEA